MATEFPLVTIGSWRLTGDDWKRKVSEHRRIRALYIASLATLLFCLSACANMYKPKAVIPTPVSSQIMTDVSQPNLLQQYNAMPQGTDAEAAAKIARRNQILQELILLVDQNYEVFEGRYYGSDASVNFAGDLINLGLTGVSSVTGTAHLKSVLSAIATGTTGIKTSYLKNFYDQQTRSAVVQQMRSSRATELALLQDANHMKAAVTAYSLEAGLADITAYYNAGTIIGALQSIPESAGTQQTAAKAQQAVNSARPQSIR
jgi:hypothetical protein